MYCISSEFIHVKVDLYPEESMHSPDRNLSAPGGATRLICLRRSHGSGQSVRAKVNGQTFRCGTASRMAMSSRF